MAPEDRQSGTFLTRPKFWTRPPVASPSTFFDTAHFLARCMRYRLHTEKLQLKTLLRLDLKGATALDIGANKGIYCFWMLRAVGRSGRVIAFEPQPEMAAAIRRKQARFDWKTLEIINVALSDAEGQLNLARDRIGDGSASLETSRHRAGQDRLDVPVKRLDALADDLLAHLKFIKCDVEGHERSVFLGGEKTLRHFRPVVQFESSVDDKQTPQIFSFFRDLGYFGVLLLGDSYLPYANPDNVPHYKFGLAGHRDYLFFPPEAIGTTIPRNLAAQFPADALKF
jgi:FkbM family methyltransferase